GSHLVDDGRMRMADELKIKVNGRTWPVAASPDTPLLYVLANELELKGPRFGCGLAQCGSCSVLPDRGGVRSRAAPGAAGRRQIADHARGPRGALRTAEGARAGASAPSSAAGVHRRASAAVRLLLQRNADQGRRAAGAESKPHRSTDSHAHERPPLPLRNLSARDEGDQACGEQN